MLGKSPCEGNWSLANDCADGRLRGRRREAAEAHLGSCQACRHLVDEVTRLRWLVAEAPTASPSAGFWERCIEIVAAQVLPRRRIPQARWRLAAAMALAGVLLSLSLSRLLPRRPAQTATEGPHETARLAVPDREYIAHHEACLATHPLRASSYYLLLKARDEESNGGYWSDGWRAGAMRAVAPVGSTLGIGQRTQRRAADWLRRAVFAPRGVSYRATETVVIAGPESEAVVRLHLVHRAIDDDRRDYLAGQDQVERVVMDDGRTCWQHLPGQDRILYAPCWGADQDLWGERYLKRILDNYRVALAGLETVSGLLGRVILIAPKEGHCGPALRLCVDERTGLILRSELRSADGRTGLTSTLSQVRFAPTLSDAEFSPPVRVRTQDVIMEEGVSLPINALARHWASALMVPTVVPEGYVLEGARLVRRAQGPFVHLWYSDGLNVFSLFEGADLGGGADAPAGGDREAVHGSAAAWGSHEPFRSLCWHEQGLKLMLVGDLPREQMLRLARGVHKAS